MVLVRTKLCGHTGAQTLCNSCPGKLLESIATALLRPVKLAGTPPSIACESLSRFSASLVSAPGPEVHGADDWAAGAKRVPPVNWASKPGNESDGLVVKALV